MAGRVKADCGANSMERSYALNDGRFALVAQRSGILTAYYGSPVQR